MALKGILTIFLAIVVGLFTLLYFKGRKPQNHYEALGVTRYAEASEIKTQFRRQSLKYHPDKNKGDEEAIKRFHELVDAKETLLDPEKRRQYDEDLDKPVLGANSQTHSSPPPSPTGSWHMKTESWNCQTSTCWWFSFIRDTLWQYCSLWGFINLLFMAGIFTVVLDWAIPTLTKVFLYLLCNCFWRPLTRTKAVVAKEKEKNEDMRQKIRERYAKNDKKKK